MILPDPIQRRLTSHACPGAGTPAFTVAIERCGPSPANPLDAWHLHATCGRCGAEVCTA